MGLVKCGDCKRDVSTSAKHCPNCGAPLKKPSQSELWLLFFLLLGIVYAVSTFYTEPEEEKIRAISANASDTSYLGLCVTADTFVRNQLKSPATAKFPHYKDACKVKSLGNNQWWVSSYVDSQNSFGAMLRSHYSVVIEDKGKDEWKLINIEFNDYGFKEPSNIN